MVNEPIGYVMYPSIPRVLLYFLMLYFLYSNNDILMAMTMYLGTCGLRTFQVARSIFLSDTFESYNKPGGDTEHNRDIGHHDIEDIHVQYYKMPICAVRCAS